METEIKNAIIKSVTINAGNGSFLTAWLHLDYGRGLQSFGGLALYLPKSYSHHTDKGNFAGHFIFRCMEIAGVLKWDDIEGKAVRVKLNRNRVEAIGHILKEDWFNPSTDFSKMTEI